MLKSILGLLVSLGFAASASAAYEIQFTNSFGGTTGGYQMQDDGTTDRSDWNLTGEAYWGLDSNLQVGGLLSLADGDSYADMRMSLGVMARYNLVEELRDSIFFGGGVVYTDFGSDDSIAVALQAGKRFAISETITWTPNLSIALNVAGDRDEGHTINLNILSFSGFLD